MLGSEGFFHIFLCSGLASAADLSKQTSLCTHSAALLLLILLPASVLDVPMLSLRFFFFDSSCLRPRMHFSNYPNERKKKITKRRKRTFFEMTMEKKKKKKNNVS
jgi:hypothetical protein